MNVVAVAFDVLVCVCVSLVSGQIGREYDLASQEDPSG